jgi:hypothetical protein
MTKAGTPSVIGRMVPLASRFSSEKKAASIDDDEAKIPRTGLINPRIIDLVEDTMAQREPDPALRLQCSANAAFGAGRPPRRNARPTWRRLLEGHLHLPVWTASQATDLPGLHDR